MLLVVLVSFLALAVRSSSTWTLPEYKISQGSLATQGEFPMAAQLHISKRFGGGKCGASIISPNLLITVAHCTRGLSNLHPTSGNSLKVVAGDLPWTEDPSDSVHSFFAKFGRTVNGGQIRKVIHTIVHDEFKIKSTEHDLAILVLDKPLYFNQYIKAVNLPEPGQVFNGTGTICGWGTLTTEDEDSHDLRKAGVPLISGSSCISAFGEHGSNYIDENMICAGGNGSDACKGDSGGPLLCTSGSKQYLCGIASWGPGCGDVGVPTAYTRVSSYVSWIQEKIQEYATPTRNCSGSGQFDCGNTRCVPTSKVCNGINECGNGQDETNCGACSSNEFKCSTEVEKCVPTKDVCDGHDDCGDGSDELGCGRCSISEFECGGAFCASSLCPHLAYHAGICYEAQCLAVAGLNLLSLGQCNNDSQITCVRSVDGVCALGYRECEGGGRGIGALLTTTTPAGQTEIGFSSGCGADQFDCRNGRCIQNTTKCNGINECGNGLDEAGCGSCAEDQFKCASITVTRCIRRRWVCDGDEDCVDGSDERGCSGGATVEPCSSNQFQCQSGTCVGIDKKCNNVRDCIDGSDEKDCPKPQCSPTQFLCSTTNKCVKNSDLCDEWNDCGDRSDENPAICNNLKPTILGIPDRLVEATTGQNVELVCSTTLSLTHSNQTLPFIRWDPDTHNSTRLVRKSANVFESTLTITNISLMDSGPYRCLVGRSNASVVVAVSRPCPAISDNLL